MHEGHRKRLTGKIKNSDEPYEHELLEVLLFNACPRRNVNAEAHRLIDKFGSIAGVLQADIAELKEVEGVGESMAQYLSCLGKCLQKASGCGSFAVVRSTEEFRRFLSTRFFQAETDALETYCLDKDGRIRRICRLSDGKRGEVGADEILKLNSVYKPYGVFAAYYRAEGGCEPDAEDDKFVRMLHSACSVGGVRLYDYCIVSKDEGVFSYYVTDRLSLATGERAKGI